MFRADLLSIIRSLSTSWLSASRQSASTKTPDDGQ